MSDPYTDSDSDRDSLENINDHDEFDDNVEELNTEEASKLNSIRTAVQNWKTNEMNKNTMNNSNTKGLGSLRRYVANSARLYYDLNTFLTTSKNNEKNMNNSYYANIITAIGLPGGLSFHLKSVIQHILERDLVELPFTVEPKVINTYAEKGFSAETQFPEEE